MKGQNPYLSFAGNTEEVFNFYKSAFGGEFSSIMRWKDMPAGGPANSETDCPGGISESDADKIMHISLPVGHTVLMGSDAPSQMDGLKAGNNFNIAINTSNQEEADKIFNALSPGGKVLMPMAKAFWGSYFGMCTDKYGTQWMIGYDESVNN
jgi:PhnB protein